MADIMQYRTSECWNYTTTMDSTTMWLELAQKLLYHRTWNPVTQHLKSCSHYTLLSSQLQQLPRIPKTLNFDNPQLATSLSTQDCRIIIIILTSNLSRSVIICNVVHRLILTAATNCGLHTGRLSTWRTCLFFTFFKTNSYVHNLDNCSKQSLPAFTSLTQSDTITSRPCTSMLLTGYHGYAAEAVIMLPSIPICCATTTKRLRPLRRAQTVRMLPTILLPSRPFTIQQWIILPP